MRSRAYNKRVAFYTSTEVADGYGGNTVTDTLTVTSWAKVETVKNARRLTDLGITDPVNTIIVHVRHREDHDYSGIDQYLIYRSVKYMIHSVTNSDFNDTEIEIIAVREMDE